MILFEADWARFPTAIPDFQTKNKSWLELCAKYKLAGIRNHLFPLALINPRLQGIDPHHPDVLKDVNLMTSISLECYVNPWYYFREVARAPGESGEDAMPIRANRGNIALFWSFFNHVLFLLMQIRQTGKSLNMDVLNVGLLNIWCKGTTIGLLTKDEALRVRNIQRLKDLMDELPRYMDRRQKGDANNTEEITINVLKNRLKAFLPQQSKKLALNVGRGMTMPIFEDDEGPFQSNCHISIPAALAAGGAAREAARRANAPYGTIFTTTSGVKSTPEGAFIYDLFQNAAQWRESLLDCHDQEELTRVVTKAAKGEYRIAAVFNHTMLGYNDEWLRRRISEALASGENASADFMNRWADSSGDNPIPKELLDAIEESTQEPKYTQVLVEGYMLRWYVDKDYVENTLRTKSFIISMDTSNASGRDDISILFIDPEDLGVIGAAAISETNLFQFSIWVGKFLIEYMQSLLIIEYKSSGVAIVDYLLEFLPAKNIDPFVRLFNRAVNEPEADSVRYEEVRKHMNRRRSDVYVKYKTCFGFNTSGTGLTSRKDLYSTTLMDGLKKAASRIKDKQLVDQFHTLKTINNRTDHAQGKKDDMVIGWLLGVWLLTNGRNLAHYGLDPTKIMSKATIRPLKSMTPEEYRRAVEQQRLRERIHQLYDEMIKETNAIILKKYEIELRQLERRLILEDEEYFSIDVFMQRVNDERKRKLRSNKLN